MGEAKEGDLSAADFGRIPGRLAFWDEEIHEVGASNLV